MLLGGSGCNVSATCNFVCEGGEFWSNVAADGTRATAVADCTSWTGVGNGTAGTPIGCGNATLPIMCVQQ